MQNKIIHSNCTLRLEKNLTKDLGPCWIVTSRPLNVAEVFWIKIKKVLLHTNQEHLYVSDVESLTLAILIKFAFTCRAFSCITNKPPGWAQ